MFLKHMQTSLQIGSRRSLRSARTPLLTRHISLHPGGYPRDFVFLPNFLSLAEQRVLLAAALEKLNKNDPREYRRRRRDFLAKLPPALPEDVQSEFLPDAYYPFEQVLSAIKPTACFYSAESFCAFRVISMESSRTFERCTSHRGPTTDQN